MSDAKGTLRYIPLAQIKQNPVALRSVDKDSEEYLSLVDSVRKNGILNPILVREMPAEDGKERFGLGDGLHRYSAAIDAGLTEIPCHVKNMTDAQVEEAQILANVHKVETKPAEYSKALYRLLQNNPLLTMSELAERLSKSTSWLNQRLSLNKLVDSISTLVDENKIGLANAYVLAKLPEEEQPNYLEQAQTQSPAEFVPMIDKRAAELRAAKREGRKPNKDYIAHPFLQRIKAIKEAIDNPTTLSNVYADVKDVPTAFKRGLEWTLHLDPISFNELKEAHDVRVRQQEEDKVRRKAEREEKAKKDAEEKANKVRDDMEAKVPA